MGVRCYLDEGPMAISKGELGRTSSAIVVRGDWSSSESDYPPY